MTDADLNKLKDGIRAGERRALARSITLLESTRSSHRDQAESLLTALLPDVGKSFRIGITGVPGVGKSTFIETLGLKAIETGHRVAVLTVDPTSVVSGGSILGDKTRMEKLSSHANAFVRPSPSGGTPGGVARRTRESIYLCEAAGYDYVIVETVGVGQSELRVAQMTDFFLLLILPASGDELQGIKRGVMELADLILVNKADDDLQNAARRTLSSYTQAIRLMQPRVGGWQVPVLAVSALRDQGISETLDILDKFQIQYMEPGLTEEYRAEQSRHWLRQEVRDGLIDLCQQDPVIAARLKTLENDVEAGRVVATVAARQLVDEIAQRRAGTQSRSASSIMLPLSCRIFKKEPISTGMCSAPKYLSRCHCPSTESLRYL